MKILLLWAKDTNVSAPVLTKLATPSQHLDRRYSVLPGAGLERHHQSRATPCAALAGTVLEEALPFPTTSETAGLLTTFYYSFSQAIFL